MRGGDGALLHGLVDPPSWLAAGADLRLAGVVNDVGARSGAEVGVFPMQVDLYLRFEAGDFSLYLNGGLRGGGRDPDPIRGLPSPDFSSRLISREHYLTWQPSSTGWYARLGRFFAPYGLRLAEHPLYIRRYNGFDTLQETYNLSGGYLGDRWELHLTAFTPDFVRETPGEDGSGGALYYERRAGDRATYGVQARVVAGDGFVRATGGAVGKLWLPAPRLMLLAQLDLGAQSFDGDATHAQLVGFLGASWFPVRGLMTTLMLERYDRDLDFGQTSRSAVGAEVQWFPYAHIEVSLWGRIAMIGRGSEDGDFGKTVLLQVHYYL
jgi:hypothetical protein